MREPDKKNIPYTGYDTIRFIDTANNTLTFIGQGVVSDYSCNYVTSDPACPPDQECFQYYEFKFKEINDKATLKIGNYKEQAELPLTVNNSDLISIKFEGKRFTLYHTDFGYVRPNYLESLIIGNNTYKDIYYWHSNFNDANNSLSYDTNNTLYYNVGSGIVKMQLQNKTWTIK